MASVKPLGEGGLANAYNWLAQAEYIEAVDALAFWLGYESVWDGGVIPAVIKEIR